MFLLFFKIHLSIYLGTEEVLFKHSFDNETRSCFKVPKTSSSWNFLVYLFSRITRFLCYALLGNDSNPPCDEYIMGLLALQRRGNPAPLYPMANLNRILKGHSFFLDPGKRGFFPCRIRQAMIGQTISEKKITDGKLPCQQ